MKEKFAAMGLITLTLTTCGTPAAGIGPNTTEYKNISSSSSLVLSAEERELQQTLLEQEAIRLTQLAENTDAVEKAINKLDNYVGKTWYVFSGSTPSGWDCSGMTMWFYEQLGIELEHSASKQAKAGEVVKSPKLGDIVVFKYKNSKSAYHVGIWIDEDTMIHAPSKGQRTRIESISDFGGNYSKVSYVRYIETN